MDRSAAQKGIFAILLITFCLCSGKARAQHPLVGTWEMVSIKGINAEGERFSVDTTTARETKIITPTHYMLIAQDVEGDSLVFNRSYAGAVRFDGDQYIEMAQLASVQIFDNVQAAFTWKVDGDKFIQSGTITRPDGKKVVLEALVFRRAKTILSFPDNPAIGVWHRLTSSSTTPDGKSEILTDDTAKRLYLVTHTHWMWISYRNKKFDLAMGGTYTIKDGKTYPQVAFASIPLNMTGKMELTTNLRRDKLYLTGTSTLPDGKKYTWEDVFRKAQ